MVSYLSLCVYVMFPQEILNHSEGASSEQSPVQGPEHMTFNRYCPVCREHALWLPCRCILWVLIQHLVEAMSFGVWPTWERLNLDSDLNGYVTLFERLMFRVSPLRWVG